MDSVQFWTDFTLLVRPWIALEGPVTPEVVYQNAREIIYGSSGGASVS